MTATRIIGGKVMGWAVIRPGRAAYVVLRVRRPVLEVDHGAGVIRIGPPFLADGFGLDVAIEKAMKTYPARRRHRKGGAR